MRKYKIGKYDKLYLKSKDKDLYTFHKKDNNCEDIKVRDVIELDGRKFIIDELVEFEKSFGIRGDNVTVSVEEYICDCQLGMVVAAHNSNCPFMKNLFGDE
jgi:hypothetical protein